MRALTGPCTRLTLVFFVNFRVLLRRLLLLYLLRYRFGPMCNAVVLDPRCEVNFPLLMAPYRARFVVSEPEAGLWVPDIMEHEWMPSINCYRI